MAEAQPTEITKEPTQAQKDLEKAQAIIKPLASKGKSEDEMTVALINAGFTARKALNYTTKALEALGVRMSAKDRYEQVSEYLLENDFDPKSWDEVLKVADWLAQELDSTDEKQAMVAIRKFAKDNAIELPAKPKGKGGGRGPGLKGMIFSWLIENPNGSRKDLEKVVKDNTDRPELHRYYLSLFDLCADTHKAKVEAGV